MPHCQNMQFELSRGILGKVFILGKMVFANGERKCELYKSLLQKFTYVKLLCTCGSSRVRGIQILSNSITIRYFNSLGFSVWDSLPIFSASLRSAYCYGIQILTIRYFNSFGFFGPLYARALSIFF